MPLVGGEQINRTWTTLGVGAVGLVIVVTGVANLFRPAFRAKHPVSGGVSFEVLNRGSIYSSGGLMVNLGGVNGTGTTLDAGVAVEVIGGTLSGSNIFASRTFTGTNVVAALRFSGAGLSDCDTAGTSKLLWDAATKRFSCGTDADTNTTYTAGQGLTLNGTAFRLNATVTGSTLSGTHIVASRSLTVSGALLVKTSITSKGSLSGATIAGFNLGSCNGSTQKILYNNSTQKFECGSDQTGTSVPFGTGNVLTIGDARYLRRSGGTMTGQLVINITGGNFNTVGLKVINTLSGAHLHAERTLTTSGTIKAVGNITTTGTVSGALIRSGLLSVSPVTLELIPTGTGTAITTGSGRIRYVVPKTMTGFKIYDATFSVDTAGTTNATKIQVRNLMKGNRKIFSTPPQIDSGTKTSDVSGTPLVINGANADVSGGDYLYVDYPAVSTTPPKGGNLILYLYKP